MRRTVLFGIVLLCVTAVSFLAVTPVERKILIPDGTTLAAPTKPAQVEVTNFPAVQAVNGTVSVGNLPAVENVSGTVAVSNLPLDGNGHLVVAVQNLGPTALVLHSTTTTYQGNLGGRTGATQKCQAEFPGSHFAQKGEIWTALGIPGGTITFTGNVRGVVWLVSETSASWADDYSGQNCSGWSAVLLGSGSPAPGYAVSARGIDVESANDYCDQFHPLLCAE